MEAELLYLPTEYEGWREGMSNCSSGPRQDPVPPPPQRVKALVSGPVGPFAAGQGFKLMGGLDSCMYLVRAIERSLADAVSSEVVRTAEKDARKALDALPVEVRKFIQALTEL